MSRSVDVIIIGGGAVGLSVALAAAEAGAEVIVMEADRLGRAASFANAGLIVPGFSLPLANPESIKGLPDLLWGEDKSLNLKLRLDRSFLRWTLAFLASCRQEKMLQTAAVISRLAQRSLSLLAAWDPEGSQFGYRQSGWLHLYQSESGWQSGLKEAELLRGLGVRVERLDSAQVNADEPTLNSEVLGGLYYPEEAQVRPDALCTWLAERARQLGVQLMEGTRVTRLVSNGNRIVSAELPEGRTDAGSFVLAAGAWSGRLLQPLIGWLPLEPAKGYSLTFRAPARKPARPLMWAEQHVVITPYSDQLRLTTGLDLAGFNDRLDPAMLGKLRKVAGTWINTADPRNDGEPWYGYRPLTPDSLPILGPTASFPNLFLATGHGQLGITLAPISGQLVAAQLAGDDPGADAVSVSPARFGL